MGVAHDAKPLGKEQAMRTGLTGATRLCQRCGAVETDRKDRLCYDCWNDSLAERIEFERGYEEWDHWRKERERNDDE